MVSRKDESSAARTADTPLRIVGAALSGALVLAAVGLVALLVVAPKVTGGAALTVLTGSMQPTLRPGDVVVVRGIDTADVCRQVSIGDIITYLPKADDPGLITHRVVAKTVGTFDDQTTCRLITQGDANSAADDPISPKQVRGVFWYGLPRLGWAKQWLVDNPAVVVVAMLVVAAAWWLVPRRRPARVVTLPAPQQPGDRALHERELALREREVAVREAELALVRTREAAPGLPGDRPAPGDAPPGERAGS